MKFIETDIISQEHAYTLVGSFMCRWAIAENAVDKAIGEALELNIAQSFLIRSNFVVRKKLDLLITLTNMSTMKDDEKKHYANQIGNLRTLSTDRNIVAHCAFFPTEDNTAVKFLRVTSNPKGLNVPDIRWTRRDFLDRSQRLMDSATELNLLSTKIRQAISYRKLAEVMAGIHTNPFSTRD